MENPYQPPSPLDDDDGGGLLNSKRQTVSLETISFVSDWSQAGLRARRARPFYRVLDVAFGIVTLGTLVSIATSVLSGFGYLGNGPAARSSLCCMVPLWFVSAAIASTHWSYRSAATVMKTARGLAGKVTGRIEGPWLTLIGPQVSVCAHVDACTQFTFDRERLMIQFPGCPESFSVSRGDITTREKKVFQQSELQAPSTSVIRKRLPKPLLAAAEAWIERSLQMLDAIDHPSVSPITQSQIVISGYLSGRDLRGTARYRMWCSFAALVTGGGIAAFAAAYWLYISLPPWVKHRPSHYVLTESETNQYMLVYLVLLVGLMLCFGAFYRWSKLRVQIGAFAVAIQPERVVIASDDVGYAYTGDALKHFRWTPQGLSIHTSRFLRPTFLVPASWMSEEQQTRVAAWFDGLNPTAVPKPTFYLRPQISSEVPTTVSTPPGDKLSAIRPTLP